MNVVAMRKRIAGYHADTVADYQNILSTTLP
jgi:hypothetical protein